MPSHFVPPSATIAVGLQCGALVKWAQGRCVAKSARSDSGKFSFWSTTEYFHSLYWFFFNDLFFFCCNHDFGYYVFLFFFSDVFCFISSIVLFTSRNFSFMIFSRKFLSAIAVIYCEVNNFSTEMVLKLFLSHFRLVFSKILPVFHFPIV